MNNDTIGESSPCRVGPAMRSHASPLRPRWAAPAVLALALVWPLGVAAECTSGEGCLTTALDGLVGGFTGAAGSDLWGWMIGGGQSAGPDQITSELQSIQSTLDTISNELVDIENELSALKCGIDADFIAQYAGPIQYYYQTYADWLNDMQNGAVLRLDDVSQWANCAVGSPIAGQTCQEKSIVSLMSSINVAATEAAGSSGSISDCVAAQAAKAGQPPSGSLDDRPYYIDNVQPITDWYFTINTQAMIVLAEAYHFRAWQAAGSPTSSSADDIVANVCPAGTSLDDCIDPITKYGKLGNNVTGEFLTYVYGQFKAGGAPLSTDSHLVVNGEGQMLVRSIEIYNEAAGAGCPNPQVEPDCGPTVGQWNFKGPLESYPVGPYGYGGGGAAGTWRFSDASVFEVILNQGFNQTQTQPIDGTVTPGEFLCTMSMTPNPSSCTQANSGLGLENADKLLLFPQSITFNIENEVWIYPLMCFMDGYLGRATSNQPFCTQQTFDNILLSGRKSGCLKGVDAKTPPGLVSPIPYYPDWYEGYYCSGWNPLPGYQATNSTNANPPGFWWPALPLDTITCDNGKSALDSSNLNPAGLPQLCRQKDFNIWFEAIVPPGPTTTTAIADATIDAAAPNTNDGASAEIRLAGGPHGGTEVALVGFDPAQLQAFLEAGPLDNAQLILTRVDTSVDGSGRGPKGNGKKEDKSLLVLRPLQSDFVEGTVAPADV